MEERILEILTRLEEKVDNLETQVNENAQVLKALRKDLLQIEGVTANNWCDIIKIKKSISQ